MVRKLYSVNICFRHSYAKNRHLKSIKKHQDYYILKFQPTETVDGVTKDVELGHYLVSFTKYLQKYIYLLTDAIFFCFRKMRLNEVVYMYMQLYLYLIS